MIVKYDSLTKDVIITYNYYSIPIDLHFDNKN